MIEAHAAERVGAVVTYGAGAAAIIFGLTAAEFAGIVAAIVCVLSYLTTQGLSAFFRLRELRILELADARHAAMERERLDATIAAMERNTIMSLPTITSCETCPLNIGTKPP
jgi:hypothetical protein